MRFYLGTHMENWLGTLNVPLFVSHRRLQRRKRLPIAHTSWALDSGAFTELRDHGRFRMSVEQYAEAVGRYAEEIGRLEWAAPMDWMCEPFITDKTGLSVREHQERTVENYLGLRDRGPFVPVLQGWTLTDYERCVALYADAGVDLRDEPLVGVGSVCRRQNTAEIARIFRELASEGLRLHGFGIKAGIASYGQFLSSADSMAWSYNARRHPALPGCAHKSCANCPRYALRWRERLLRQLAGHLDDEQARPRLWQAA